MHSCSSTSDVLPAPLARETISTGADGLHDRQTASDRPGVAQPVPQRPIPQQPWGAILIGALAMFVLLIGAWEWYWRDFGARPGIRNTHALWAIQRRRIDHGEGGATVVVGASRIFFDLQLDAWERLDGTRPIQLAFEGTSPVPFMEDLAADPNFTGRLIVGVAPEVFFEYHGYHAGALKDFRTESPAQRIGQWLSMRFVEPFLAFYDPDYALATVLQRQSWPDRPGKPTRIDIRKIAVLEADRNAHVWSKLDDDPAYRALTRRIWSQKFTPAPDAPSMAESDRKRDQQIERAAKAVAALRAHGVSVLFVRPPSSGPYLEFDERIFPRATSWDALLAKTGAPGIHFADYPELQGFELPEWSHISQADARRFTEALYRIIAREYWPREAPTAAEP